MSCKRSLSKDIFTNVQRETSYATHSPFAVTLKLLVRPQGYFDPYNNYVLTDRFTLICNYEDTFEQSYIMGNVDIKILNYLIFKYRCDRHWLAYLNVSYNLRVAGSYFFISFIRTKYCITFTKMFVVNVHVTSPFQNKTIHTAHHQDGQCDMY